MGNLNTQIETILKGVVAVVSDATTLGAQQGAEQRAAYKYGLPQVTLGYEHLRGCELLPTREALLEHMPKGGMAAEFGVDHGAFSETILRICAPQRLFLVDMWSESRFAAGLQTVSAKFTGNPAVEIVQADSVTAMRRLAQIFPQSFDWVYIDTTHAYRETSTELPAAAALLRPGGYICGDDHCTGNVMTPVPYGVIEAVQEFCVRDGWRYRYLTMDRMGHSSFALQKI
jgi:hypothetical protein